MNYPEKDPTLIRQVLLSDAQVICDIYNVYVTETTVTFEETPVTRDKMARRIEEATEIASWLVYSNIPILQHPDVSELQRPNARSFRYYLF